MSCRCVRWSQMSLQRETFDTVEICHGSGMLMDLKLNVTHRAIECLCKGLSVLFYPLVLWEKVLRTNVFFHWVDVQPVHKLIHVLALLWVKMSHEVSCSEIACKMKGPLFAYFRPNKTWILQLLAVLKLLYDQPLLLTMTRTCKPGS